MPSFGLRVRSIFQISALLVVCILAALQTSSAGSIATVTYRFVGVCGDCLGTGVGQLTLQGYTLGNQLDISNFVSFTYVSNLLPNFSISQGGATSLTGSLPASIATTPARADVQIQSGHTTLFRSFASDGEWCVGSSSCSDWGGSHTWSPPTGSGTPTVPTLSTAALGALALLLAGAGALLARARTTSRA